MTQTQRDQIIANLNQIKKDLKHPNRIAFIYNGGTTSLNIYESDDVYLVINEIKKIIDNQISSLPSSDLLDIPSSPDHQ